MNVFSWSELVITQFELEMKGNNDMRGGICNSLKQIKGLADFFFLAFVGALLYFVAHSHHQLLHSRIMASQLLRRAHQNIVQWHL